MNRLSSFVVGSFAALLFCPQVMAAELPDGVNVTSKSSRIVILDRAARQAVQFVVADDRPLEVTVVGPKVLELHVRAVQPAARKRPFEAELTVLEVISGAAVSHLFRGGDGRSAKTKSARLQFVSPGITQQLAIPNGDSQLRISLTSATAEKFVVGLALPEVEAEEPLRFATVEPAEAAAAETGSTEVVAAAPADAEPSGEVIDVATSGGEVPVEELPATEGPAIEPETVPAIRVVVADTKITAADLDPVIGESISTVLSAELALRGGERYSVMSRNDVKNILVQQAEQLMLGNCADAACAKDLGELAKADQAVTSSIAHIGEEWVFTLELVDVHQGIVLSRQAVNWKGPPGGLVELCRPYVARLLEGSAAEGYLGGVQVLTNEDDALVHLDERSVGRTPVALVAELPIGKHSLRIFKDGYLPYQTDLVVNRNETTIVQAQLVDEASLKPWYTRWWLWTGAAAIVGGSIAAAILLTGDDASTTVNIETPLP